MKESFFCVFLVYSATGKSNLPNVKSNATSSIQFLKEREKAGGGSPSQEAPSPTCHQWSSSPWGFLGITPVLNHSFP